MNLKSNKAITLVALIITIIILLILAGVSLSMVLGDNGLINKAQSSVDKYQESANNEQALLNEIEDYMARETDKPHSADGTWDDNKQVNTPKLADGMIPIKWNGTNWVITTGTDPDWYNYKTVGRNGTVANQWANVMLSDGKYSSVTPTPSGKTAATKDTIVAEADLGSMFVWIPRYAYNIKSGYQSNIAGEIQVEFLQGTAKTSSQGNSFENINAAGSINTLATGGNNKWLVHPAFLNNTDLGGWDRELEGIWVAKFEASSTNPSATNGGGNVTDLNVKVLPNTISWRSITEANIFTNCLSMKNTNNIYGLATTSEPHEMKNSEWGAVAYLTHSKYGRNGTEIGINDGSYYTGENNYVSNVEQSTTGNVYGIYDMSGGAWEYTAAGLTANVTSIFGSITGFAEKYVNRYNGSSSDGTENYNANSGKYGDAVYETSNPASSNTGSWNGRCANFVSSSDPFFARGGDYLISRAAGTCAFSCSGPYYSIGFRPTLVV